MIDFIELINQNVSLTAEEKQAFLDDFCEAHGYTEGNKKAFANQEFITFVKGSVERVRDKRAKETTTFEELILE